MRLNADWLWSKLKDRHLEELVRGAFGFLNFRLLGTVFNYVFIYLVAQWYGAEILGIFALSLAVLRIALLYGRMGLDNALVRFIAGYAAIGRKDFVKQVYLRGLAASIPCSLGISLLLYFGAPFLAKEAFHNPAMTGNLRIIAVVVLPGTLLYINASVLRGLKCTASYSFLINVSQFMLGCLVLIPGKPFLETNSAPVTAFAAATAAAAVTSFLFGAVPRRGKTHAGTGNQAEKPQPVREPREPEGAVGTGGLLKVAFPMLLTGSYSFFLQWTGTLALGFFRTEAEVGIYNVAVRIATLLTFTLSSINSIAASKFSESYAAGDTEGFKKITLYATRMIFWTTAPVGLVLVTFPAAISGFFGKEIAGGATALVILVIGYFTNAVSGPVGTILNMTGHQMVFQKIVFVAALVNIILNILLIPPLGINGAAIAGTVSMCIWNIVSVIYVKRKFNVLTLYIPFLIRERGKS